MNITVVGAGYVGLSTAVHLAKKHTVTALDVNEKTVSYINKRKSPLKEKELAWELSNPSLRIKATLDPKEAYKDCDFAIIAVPTSYDYKLNSFDTSILDTAIDTAVSLTEKSIIIIKSTAPIGYTDTQIEKWKTRRILFSPEFMREGRSLYDVSHPSRIIIGAECSNIGFEYANLASDLFFNSSLNAPPVLLMGTKEAESVKLFANTYLAMRVAFFNELDAYAEANGLNTRQIINGVCFDSRIGVGYANPSFGYGGYCLPKDTLQLAGQMKDVPGCLIKSIPEANAIRIRSIAEKAASMTDGIIGVYGLAMKSGSDNARASASVKIVEYLVEMGKKVLIYEPTVSGVSIDGAMFTENLDSFKEKADIILTNRMPNIDFEGDVLYTRDVFGNE